MQKIRGGTEALTTTDAWGYTVKITPEPTTAIDGPEGDNMGYLDNEGLKYYDGKIQGEFGQIKGDMSDLSESIVEISKDVNDLIGEANIDYVQTGTGYIAETGNGATYDPNNKTGNNQMMLISDAELISSINKISATLGNNMMNYGIICMKAGSVISLSKAPFPQKDTEAHIVECEVPEGTISIYIYNRKPVLENPKITVYLKNGINQRLEDITDNIDALTERVDRANELNAQVNNTFVDISISDLEDYQNGYVNNTGDLIAGSASHMIKRMSAKGITEIKFIPKQNLLTSLGFGALYSANGTAKQAFYTDGSNAKTFFVNAEDDDIIYISDYNYKTSPNPYYDVVLVKNYKKVTDAYSDEIKQMIGNTNGGKYRHCVKKPFDFNGKKLQFFGDSITYGYLASGGQATNNYPKTFSQSVGASFINSGVSGSSLANVSGYGCIYDKIQSDLDTSADVVFVAGGVNDWQLGVSEATLKTAVENICNYLKQNFNGEVVFITPINHSGRIPIATPKQTIENIRNVITRIALINGFSVVQGWEFPFPMEEDDATYKAEMFQDNLHPTELGYKLYAQALRNALL